MALSALLRHQRLRQIALSFAGTLVLAALMAGLSGPADAQQATAVPTAAAPAAPTPVGSSGAIQVVRQPMSLSTIIAIAVVAAAASAVNGLVGAIFLFVIWMWLYGGVLPSIPIYLKEPPQYPWAPHLLLPLIVFLLFWQYRLRGKIGPAWGLRDLVRQAMARRGDASFAP
jgi:hypothetical protein